jgi:hypothetical protein
VSIWKCDSTPTEPGWYAVLICRDPYQRETWRKSIEVPDAHTITAFAPQRFNTDVEAQTWARQHDPER